MSILQHEIVRGNVQSRRNGPEKRQLRLIRRVARGRSNGGCRTASARGRPGWILRVADANANVLRRQSKLFSDHLCQHRFDAAADILHARHQFNRTILMDAHFGGRIHMDDAIPNRLRDAHAALDRPGIAARLAPLVPAELRAADAAFHSARLELVVLVAEIERVHPKLFRQFINALFKREAALRMTGRPERGSRTAVDENVVFLRVHVRALIHVDSWTGAARACAAARRAILTSWIAESVPSFLAPILRLWSESGRLPTERCSCCRSSISQTGAPAFFERWVATTPKLPAPNFAPKPPPMYSVITRTLFFGKLKT